LKHFLKEESTSLHLAATLGKSDIVEYLLKHKVKIDVVDIQGRTPLYMAILNGFSFHFFFCEIAIIEK
jgi:ankyrin repeat protein